MCRALASGRKPVIRRARRGRCSAWAWCSRCCAATGPPRCRYFWRSFGLAEAVEENGDLYGRSEIHRHLGFYYLAEDVRPEEAVRQLGYSLALRERLGDPRRIPSALVALGEAELAAGNLPRAVELLSRALILARRAGLQSWRVRDAEQHLREAEAALAAAT